VVGGNVSFYNESFGEAIYPTPVIGMLGLMPDVDDRLTSDFKTEDDRILLLGETRDELGGSEYMKVIRDKVAGRPPAIDWDAENALVKLLTQAASKHILSSAHDLSEGGLAVALAESCMQGGIGARVNMGEVAEPHVTLFSETQARALVSVTPENLEAFKMMASDLGVPVREIGLVGGDSVRVAGAFELDLAQIKEVYDTALEKMIAGAHH